MLWNYKKGLSGFTEEEVARFLSQDISSDRIIKVIPKGSTKVLHFSPEQFFTHFHVKYLLHLHVDSRKHLKQVINQCPWILRSSLAEENHELGKKFSEEVMSDYVADLVVKWIDEEIGYGLFAGCDIAAGSYIGEYTGNVRRLFRTHPDHNVYCFHYPTKWWSWKYFVVDALKEGNELRFINHSDTPNLTPLCLYDRKLLHLVFVAKEMIPKNTELTFDYGPDFWQTKKI